MTEELQTRLTVVLVEHPDALAFINAFQNYCHAIDDFIDEPPKNRAEGVLYLLQEACRIYSSDFYHRHRAVLYPMVINITNAYADSVLFEKSPEQWKRATADVLRHCGNDMLMIIVATCAGYKALRAISPLIREEAFNRHAEDSIIRDVQRSTTEASAVDC